MNVSCMDRSGTKPTRDTKKISIVEHSIQIKRRV